MGVMNDWGLKKFIKFQLLVFLMNLMMEIEMVKNYRYWFFCYDLKMIVLKQIFLIIGSIF